MFAKTTVSFVALSGLIRLGFAAHGDGAEGTVMGPVAFLWPNDRVWSAAYDNIGPCGSSSSVTNRTEFPLGSIGSIELTIADDAYNLAVRIAYGNDPTTQNDFTTIKSNITELEPGHQCYSIPTEPSTVAAGSNATIQLEYWANDSNKNESFFACADITFIKASAFTEQVVCFNVTTSGFDNPSGTASPTPHTTATQAIASATSTPAVIEHSSGGLSGGAKAGIAVGSIIGGIFLLVAAFLLRRHRAASRGVEAADTPADAVKPVRSVEVASIGSADTAH